MPEDAGKKKFIKDFLQRVRVGEGFIEDIWIERSIKTPGLPGEGSTARSLSGRQINNITELLEDDLKHSFDDGYFTFRIVSALKGSGKTSLLTYLHELSKTKLAYKNFSVVSRFPFTNITSIGGNFDFSVKFYCYVLAETFWQLVNDSDILVRNKAISILDSYLGDFERNQLKSSPRLEIFRSKFIQSFSNIPVVFEELLFEIINEISQIKPQYTFAYLIDEFDALEKRPNDLQQTLSLIRALIKRSAQEFGSKIRLFIYFVGTSENIKSLFNEDPVIESLVGHQVINLNSGYGNEFEMIKIKINERIKGAFSGYKDFDIAWQEIQSLSLKPVQTLRGFCQEYAAAILEIHEKYFNEKPEQHFEGNARSLAEAQCRKIWQNYLIQKSYSLSSVSTTTILKGHAFDCYVELLHNGIGVAKCFGEAKNYELLSGHLKTFNEWLEDVKFNPCPTNGDPQDLAFMIAPSCPSLLQRKLELKNINLIISEKIIGTSSSSKASTINLSTAINLNTADKNFIISALKGTRIKEATINRLITTRKNKPYGNLDDLVSNLKLTSSAKEILKKKINNQEICFL